MRLEFWGGIMSNIEMEYMKAYANIASEAITAMALVWEQMQFNKTEPEILAENYPLDKSFDEFAFEFSQWIHNWT